MSTQQLENVSIHGFFIGFIGREKFSDETIIIYIMKHQVPVFIPGSQLVSNSEVPNRSSPNTYKYFKLFLKTVQYACYVKKVYMPSKQCLTEFLSSGFI
jgi:hypothetical protein